MYYENKRITQNNIALSIITNTKDAPSIIFLHGNSLAAETFLFQLNDKNLNRYHLVAPEFPGHGHSAKPEDPEEVYSITGFRDVMIGFVQQHIPGDFIFAGHSLGGHVAIECLPFLPNCKGLMIWGTPPASLPINVPDLFHPHPDLGLFFQQHLTQAEIKRLSGSIVAKEHVGEIMKMISQSDPEFRAILPISYAKGKISDELDIVKKSNLPKAIVHGKKDRFVRADYLESLQLSNIFRGGIQYIPDAGHTPQMDQPDVFNEILLNFATHSFEK